VEFFAECAKDGAPSGAEARFLFVRFTRRLSAALPRRCMGSAGLACGTTDVVPFLGLALSESSEGWGCGIPPFAKSAKDGVPLRLPARTASARAEARFLFGRLYAALKRRSSTVLHGFGAVGFAARLNRGLPRRGAFRILRGMGLWNSMSRKRRETWGTLRSTGADDVHGG